MSTSLINESVLKSGQPEKIFMLVPKSTSSSREFIETLDSYERGEIMPQTLNEALDVLTVAYLVEKFEVRVLQARTDE